MQFAAVADLGFHAVADPEIHEIPLDGDLCYLVGAIIAVLSSALGLAAG